MKFLKVKIFIHIKAYLLFLFLILSSNISFSQSEYKLPDGCSELLLQLNYYGLIRSDIIAYIYNKQVYLPFLEILNKLMVYYEFDYPRKIIEGYVNNKDSSFYIDFRTGKGEVFDSKLTLDKSDYLIDMTEVYVLGEVFNKIFMIKADVNMLRLTVGLDSKIQLPIMKAYKRYKGYSFLKEDISSKQEFSPLMFDSERSILNGGTIYYTLRYNQNRGNRNYSYTANTGIALLGGDLQLNSYGSYLESNRDFNYRNQYRWRLNFGDNSYLTNVIVGNLYSSGGFRYSTMPSDNFTGLQITNEQAFYRTYFSTIVYEEQIEPGWQVELYKNGFLVEHKVTDAEGYYRFDLPVAYGTSNIELRYYGSKGQYLVKKEIIQIPNEFLSPGEIRYVLNFGESESDKLKFAELRMALGLTNWLSNSFSINKFDSAVTFIDLTNSETIGTFKNINLYNSLSVRLLSNLFTTFDYSMNNLYSLELNYWPFDLGSYKIKYSLFEKKSRLNYSGSSSILEAYFQIPKILNLPFSLSVNYRRNDYTNTINNNIYSNLFFNIGYLMLFTNYSATILQSKLSDASPILSHNMNINFTYNWFDKPKFLDFIDHINFGTGIKYDITNNKIQSIDFSFNQTLFKKLYLTYKLSRSFGFSNDYNMSLGLRMDLSDIRSMTNFDTYNMKDVSISQELQGILGYNSALNEIMLSNSTMFSNIGNGSANIRVFLDENANGEYDDNEKVIPDVKVNVQEATSNNRSTDGMIQLYSLIPYKRYNVTVDKSSFKNPLWIPKFSEFSFIADPNVYKAIDIPCYTGAVLTGKVFKKEGASEKGQPGVKIHVISIDSSYIDAIPVFSDGSYYKLGIPPGDYIAFVDSLQLKVLQVYSEPAISNFTIKQTIDGDFVEGINFELLPISQIADKALQRKSEQPFIEKSAVSSQKLEELTVSSVESADEDKIQRQTANPQPQNLNHKLTILNYPKTRDIDLTREMTDYLNNIAKYMNENPRATISIVAHTDNFGSLETTQSLSDKRAEYAAFYLKSKGISLDRILYRGEGSRNPIASNTTPDGRKKNRRLEIRIIE